MENSSKLFIRYPEHAKLSIQLTVRALNND